MKLRRDRRDRSAEQRDPWRVEGAEHRGAFRSVGALARRFWWFVLILLALNWWVASIVDRSHQPLRVVVPYTYFREAVQAGKVDTVTSTADKIQGTFRRPVRYPPDAKRAATRFATRRPAFADDALLGLLVDKDVEVNARPPEEGRPLLLTLLISIAPALLIVGMLLLVLRRTVGNGGMAGMGRSRAKRFEASSARTKFTDVAGIDEAKEELIEIVDFLRDPDRYHRLGAAIPKGVLLSGPPGTGKTLLARAVAGEADVPFFSLSASEFVEMVVGVGASRVRDLFAQAKEAAPAIVFIDELDAVGRARGGGIGNPGGLDEREQTLNQILTEMDGFSAVQGVIVLAATNRPEILDSALLRPGRFDRRVVVSPPDVSGREKILEVHTRDVPLADDIDLRAIASQTVGMVGADLRNLVNEAALAAARDGDQAVSRAQFGDAIEKTMLGAERRITISREDKERTAYHEAGHALLGMIEPGADRVRKVSIVPRGRTLGVTFQSPVADRYGYNTAYLRGRIIGAMGGRAAEDLIYGDVTTGAESDLELATSVARQMVGRWGMSEAVGQVQLLPPGDGRGAMPALNQMLSEATRELLDSEIRRIIGECYEEARTRLKANRSRLDALAQALLENETLDEQEAHDVAGFADLLAGPPVDGNGKPVQVARRWPPRFLD